MVIGRRGWRLARRVLQALRGDLAGFLAAVTPPRPLRAGLFSYRFHPPGGTRRIHLRIQPDGSGLLMVDVTDVVRLNPTATLVAKAALEGRPPDRTVAGLRRRFRGTEQRLLDTEAERIYRVVEHLATTTDACPTCGLTELGRAPLFGTPPDAPYKADLALSYGCNNACRHCYNEPDRKPMPSLEPDRWRRVLRKLAALGIPHVIFTGGEPTLFAGLAELVRCAERLGLVSGLNTNGRRLADRSLTRSLARAGLSHVQITLQSCLPDVHNAIAGAPAFHETVRGIENCLEAGLHTITNTTLTRRNAEQAEAIVEFLHGLGVRTFAANGMIYSGRGRTSDDALPEAHLAPLLVALRDRAAELGMRMLWYTPTPYCRLSPLELELGPRRCNAAEYSIAVEPNGDVLPCQSYYVPAGNLLRDPWPAIWQSPLFRSFRNRVADPAAAGLPVECWDCPDLSVCGGGCRLEREKLAAAERPAVTVNP